MESDFVRMLSQLKNHLEAYLPYRPVDFLEPASRREIMRRLKDKDMTMKELCRATGYSRKVTLDALEPFLKAKIILPKKENAAIYTLDTSSPLTVILLGLHKYLDSGQNSNSIIQSMMNDERVIALSIFSYNNGGGNDRKNLQDVMIIIEPSGDGGTGVEIEHPQPYLYAFTHQYYKHLIKRDPWFLTLFFAGKLLKGREYLKGYKGSPAIPRYRATASEIEAMLKKADSLSNSERAELLAYCIRTALTIRLYSEGRMDRKNFYEELLGKHPEFWVCREYDGSSILDARIVFRIKRKVLKELDMIRKNRILLTGGKNKSYYR
jgi:hypothetical protein